MEKGGTCSKAAKGTPTKEASVPYKGRSAGKGKSTGKGIEKSKGKGSSMHGQAMRGATRMEEEFSSRVEKESKETLW